jgi:L-lysine 6-transaminase
MNRSSLFKRKIDFQNSQGSYLVDKDSGEKYLDYFGQYATLAIGYNHPIFKSKNYLHEIQRVAHQKITNCEILSDESAEFDEKFREFTSKGLFSHYHYTCTGALAIEAAIKTAIDYKGSEYQRVISFKCSFHGINGYGGMYTDRFEPVNQRLNGFPRSQWEPLDNPVIEYEDGVAVNDEGRVKKVLSRLEKILVGDVKVCAILIEPIQCTFGDRYFPNSFFIGVRQLATQYDIPLIFDEIQIGFGGTGKLWYYEHLPIEPDILVFGKKAQLSGIAVQENFSTIFNKAIRLEVTWDADIIDMIRCKYIMQVYADSYVFNNVIGMADRLKAGILNIPGIINVRNCGLIFGFDFEKSTQRDKFFEILTDNNMLCNPTRDKTIRLRPNLLVTSDEVDHALSIMNTAANKL